MYLSKRERDKMRACADLLPPPGGEVLRQALDSHDEAVEALNTIYTHAGSVGDCVDEPGKGYLEDVCDIVKCVTPEEDQDDAEAEDSEGARKD